MQRMALIACLLVGCATEKQWADYDRDRAKWEKTNANDIENAANRDAWSRSTGGCYSGSAYNPPPERPGMIVWGK